MESEQDLFYSPFSTLHTDATCMILVGVCVCQTCFPLITNAFEKFIFVCREVQCMKDMVDVIVDCDHTDDV